MLRIMDPARGAVPQTSTLSLSNVNKHEIPKFWENFPFGFAILLPSILYAAKINNGDGIRIGLNYFLTLTKLMSEPISLRDWAE